MAQYKYLPDAIKTFETGLSIAYPNIVAFKDWLFFYKEWYIKDGSLVDDTERSMYLSLILAAMNGEI
jgi:hypothetical protein